MRFTSKPALELLDYIRTLSDIQLGTFTPHDVSLYKVGSKTLDLAACKLEKVFSL